ncbi:hypothetical protein SDC9_103731 [bioreactor metagenome]|uniref:Uncharacterized protein n=1 Tax=bioreactor metagenome TaxID=1076179 RepID=A0A645B5A9_9ZZZZ
MKCADRMLLTLFLSTNVILYYGNVEILESIREEQLGIESAYREVSMQFAIALPFRRDA